MIRQSGCRVTCAFLTLIIIVIAKPPPSSSPWTTYGAGKPGKSKIYVNKMNFFICKY